MALLDAKNGMVAPVHDGEFAPIAWRTRIGVAVVALMLILVSFACDTFVQGLVPNPPDPSLHVLAGRISKYFDWPYMVLYSLIPLLAGIFWKRRSLRRLGLALVLSCALAGLLSTVIRSTTGRTRPISKEPQGFYGLRRGSKWLIGKFEYNSFPSGHTGTAVGFAAILLFGARRWTLLALAISFMVGWARIYLLCHHFSDVVTASVIGVAVGWWVWYRLMPRIALRYPKFQI